jgi:ABC-2 type transport system ATP-binding protein
MHLNNGEIKSRTKEMIHITGLEAEQHKKLGALSRGFRQRVGLAQALIHKPSVLILDEPTSGLDPNQLVEIRNLIKETGKEKTVILSTHIMQEVEAICDRVIILHKGKIVADEKTGELQRRMAGENVIVIELSGKVSMQELQSIPGINKVENAGMNKWKLLSSPEIDARTEIFRFAVEKNLTVLTLIKEESSLEEIFHKLTS